jgi:hypothetical protein
MSIVLLGSTSGSCTLQEQAIAGSTTLTLPTFNGTVGLLVSGTSVASTSGTSIEYTGLPAGIRRITVMFSGVSTNGASIVQVQIGSGSFTTSGYASSGATNGTSLASFTTGFPVAIGGAAAYLYAGFMTITNLTGNTWVASASIGTGSFASAIGGNVALGGTLDRVRVTTVNGTDTFDAGSINILYE